MEEKPIEWVGSSKDALRAFPEGARSEAGHDLFLVQQGELPRDWKPKFPESVYVLHAFQKTSRKTSRSDLETARLRYQEMLYLREQDG